MEGKEVRFGVSNSATFAAATTLTSTGAVNSFHDSYTALGGMMPMVNMMLGEVAPGGVGSGLYGMLDPRGDHGVRGRPDGRPHAGVPGQEDRRPGDQVRLAVLPDHPGAGAGRHRGGVRHRQQLDARSTSARTASPRCSTRSPRPATTTARRSPASRSTPRGGTPRSGLCMLLGRFLPIIFVLGLAGSLARQTARPRVRRARCRPTSRCSSAWSSASR